MFFGVGDDLDYCDISMTFEKLSHTCFMNGSIDVKGRYVESGM